MVRISNKSFKHELGRLSREFLSSFLITTKFKTLLKEVFEVVHRGPRRSRDPDQG